MALDGSKEVRDNLAREIAKMKLQVNRGMLKGALLVKLNSMERTPVDVGLLRASHYTSEVDMSQDDFKVEIGVDTDYAVYVHENLEAHHTVGEAKFLEKAMNENKGNVLKIIANSCKVL